MSVAETDLSLSDIKDAINNGLKDGMKAAMKDHYSSLEVENWTAGINGKTDASGNISKMEIFRTPAGLIYDVARIILWADGFTPAAPYTNAAAWAGIFQSDGSPVNILDFVPTSPGGPVFPAVAEYPQDTNPYFVAGESMVFACTSGPANTNITVLVYGVVKREKSFRV